MRIQIAKVGDDGTLGGPNGTPLSDSAKGGLKATAVQTAAYAANAGELVPCDASQGTVPVALPANPAEGDSVDVVRTDQAYASRNIVTVAGSGVHDVLQPGQRFSYTFRDGAWQTVVPASPWSVTPLPSTSYEEPIDAVGQRRALTRVRHHYRTQLATLFASSLTLNTALVTNKPTTSLSLSTSSGSVTLPAGSFLVLIANGGTGTIQLFTVQTSTTVTTAATNVPVNSQTALVAFATGGTMVYGFPPSISRWGKTADIYATNGPSGAALAASGAGSVVLNPDPDPYGPEGAIMLTIPYGSGTPAYGWVQRDLDVTVDLSGQQIIRLPMKFSDIGDMASNFYIQVSSDNFVSGNYHQLTWCNGSSSFNWFPAPRQVFLTAPLATGGPVAQLSCQATPEPLYAGDTLITRYTTTGGGATTTTQRWTVSADTPAGSTVIPVNSQTPVFAFPAVANPTVANTTTLDVLPAAWAMSGFSATQLAAVGAGADLTKINSVRVLAYVAAGAGNSLSVSLAWMEVLQPQSTRPKFVFCFDDGYGAHWAYVMPLLNQYGFRATLFPEIGRPDGVSNEQYRRMQDRGWQVGTHAYTSSEHNDIVGRQLRQTIQKSLAHQQGVGVWGGEDMAWWGGLPVNQDTLAAVKQSFRSGRYNTSKLIAAGVETLPPSNPYLMRSWLQQDGEADNLWQAYIQAAIQANGLAIMTMHNVGTGGLASDTNGYAELQRVCQYLDGLRGQIDVVTMDEALAPYTDVAALPPAPAAPPAPTVAVQQLQSGVNVSVKPGADAGGPPQIAWVVQRSTDNATWADIGTIYATGTSAPLMLKDATAANGTTYYYRARARHSFAEGAESVSVQITFTANSGRPATPASASAPSGWWRMDDITGVANGAAITTVPDDSGGGNALAVNASKYASPTLLTATGPSGSHQAARFTSASAAAFYAADAHGADNRTFLVVKRNTSAQTITVQPILTTGTTNYSTAADQFAALYDSVQGKSFVGPNNVAMSSMVPSRYPLGAGFHVCAYSIDSAANSHALTQSVDGAATTLTPAAYAAAASTSNLLVGATNGIGLGSGHDNTGSVGMDADVLEIVAFPACLSAADRKLWEDYLGTVYDIPVYAF